MLNNQFIFLLFCLFFIFFYQTAEDKKEVNYSPSPTKKQKVHHQYQDELPIDTDNSDFEAEFDVLSQGDYKDSESLEIAESEGEGEGEDYSPLFSNMMNRGVNNSGGRGVARSNTAASSNKNSTMVDLTSFMKRMQLNNSLSSANGRSNSGNRRPQKKEILPSNKPFFCYTWKDFDLNEFITLEVQLSCSGESCKVEIEEMSDGTQVVVLSQPLPRSWLNMDFFSRNIDIKENFNDSQRLAARADYMKAMSRRYGESTREDTVVAKQYFKLPFRCDDLNVRGGYPGTGYYEDVWPVLGKKKIVQRGNTYVEEREEVGYVNILTIHLVSEEKHQRRNDKTPQRRQMAAYKEDSDEEEGGGGGGGFPVYGTSTNAASSSTARASSNARRSTTGVTTRGAKRTKTRSTVTTFNANEDEGVMSYDEDDGQEDTLNNYYSPKSAFVDNVIFTNRTVEEASL